ncbi:MULTISPECIES: response regulator transcription factor [unclassified Undibacterium]|uniref:response regulator transcription factor n=1 Tax=unclassified Undibacterium TaxID=2630295 RepID=UPI002AC8C426|nr:MULTISPECIES: response regulator transcription factor [unclassified Undibacterium]MEB0139280.1 response regulator transcription factor [Undibacterium sp. CCC2.1]MEB0172124.1 response regulator transcription factor [Undibacterium sp. CCC1.1]MEB0175999.1 response regulator transcription factor [Undibacterium sp. CCC3.4]MEB0215311.1 response regulator transcription factor [Undibacterium sp. 5I2]WPX45641.1 response regulator transcription factor [Undibacterium sp. CCC3.4]
MRVLLIEDDQMIGESLLEGLSKEQYRVDWVRDGRAAEQALSAQAYPLIVLDLGLPEKSGLTVLAEYRQGGGTAAVLIITARDLTSERILGLDSGADDYLVKPFDLDELYARMRALLRRCVAPATEEFRHAGLILNPSTHDVSLHGQAIHLSAHEFKLMLSLLSTPGKVISKASLEESIYGWDDTIESNTIEVYIHTLRKKFGAEFIKNVRGVGYKLNLRCDE